MQDQKRKIMEKNTAKSVAYYRRRCWWVDEEDLAQESFLAQWRAGMLYSPAKVSETYKNSQRNHCDGTLSTWGERRAYERCLFFASVYAVRRHVLKASSPVSAGHRLDVLKGLFRAPEENATRALVADSAERAYYARQVVDRVVEVLGSEGAEFFVAMIIDEWDAQVVAQENGVTHKAVREQLTGMLDLLMADKKLHALWKEGA